MNPPLTPSELVAKMEQLFHLSEYQKTCECGLCEEKRQAIALARSVMAWQENVMKEIEDGICNMCSWVNVGEKACDRLKCEIKDCIRNILSDSENCPDCNVPMKKEVIYDILSEGRKDGKADTISASAKSTVKRATTIGAVDVTRKSSEGKFNPSEVSQCKSCGCMTHTIWQARDENNPMEVKSYCGKCLKEKPELVEYYKRTPLGDKVVKMLEEKEKGT